MQKFNAIESLRGCMAWWVVMGHALQLSGTATLIPYRLRLLLLRGDLAVQVFMIVSGFVIAHLLLSRREAYGPYIARRFLRLFPLFIVMLGIAVLSRDLYAVAYGANPWLDDPQLRIDRLAAEQTWWWAHAALHLTMMHGAVPDTLLPFASSTFVAPAWSISLEWQFYLLAPFIVAAMIENRHRWLLPVLIAGTIAAHAGLLGAWLYESFLLIALPFFLIGIASRLALERRLTWTATTSTVAATGVYLAFEQGSIWSALVALIWIVTLFAAVHENRPTPSRWLEMPMRLLFLNPVMRALGRVSYSTYLCHIPIFAIVVGSGMAVMGDSHAVVVGLTALAVALTLPASFLLYETVEKPGQALWKRWQSRK